MRFTLIASPGSAHQVEVQHALQAGLAVHGVESVLTHKARPTTKHVACWGWRMGRTLRRQGHEVLVIERAYLGDRFAWTSLAWNGLNGYGDFGEQPDDGGERFRANFTISPWRESEGEYILILGQVPGDASLQGRNLMPWYESVAYLAHQAYRRPVVFRPHPNVASKGIRQHPRHTSICFAGSLDEALRGAHLAVTFNSNSGVDAVLAGVPTLTFDPGSMAYAVSGHKVGEVLKPDRDEWAHKLAWKQWRMSEITDGTALKSLLEAAAP